ncbi:unnamed protein product [Spirodela intermedia]|uniref:Uncharacterized protein n=2 Tax=Spirodela intermedia TaxID=51605 RepID=A0A7I8KSN9_SPIIN|nr:unnamed protein product [Spirodela intermedia]CAA6664123.1 unnamed protein product [Spirodela intermedia]CAA7400651.1 unnamed protein product [Spirodela intermedia]
MEDLSFDPELMHSVFKLVWSKKSEKNGDTGIINDDEVAAGTSKKSRQTTANPNALKVSCELVRIFVTEAIERAAVIAEAEGSTKIEPTHLERVLPQLLLDF